MTFEEYLLKHVVPYADDYITVFVHTRVAGSFTPEFREVSSTEHIITLFYVEGETPYELSVSYPRFGIRELESFVTFHIHALSSPSEKPSPYKSIVIGCTTDYLSNLTKLISEMKGDANQTQAS